MTADTHAILVPDIFLSRQPPKKLVLPSGVVPITQLAAYPK